MALPQGQRHALYYQPQGARRHGKPCLAGGALTDDIAVGLPITVKDGDATTYLTPTAAGVVRLDPALRKVQLIAAGDGKTAPRALYVSDLPATVYAVDGKFVALGSGQAQPSAIPNTVPPGAVVLAVEDGPFDYVRLHWQTPQGGDGWTLAARNQPGPSASNALPVDLSRLPKFLTNRVRWGDPNPTVSLTFDRQSITATQRVDGLRQQEVRLPDDIGVFAALLVKERVVLVGKTDVYELNLNKIAAGLFAAPAQ